MRRALDGCAPASPDASAGEGIDPSQRARMLAQLISELAPPNLEQAAGDKFEIIKMSVDVENLHLGI